MLPPPIATPPVVNLVDTNETNLVGEIAVGLELQRPFRRMNLFGRLMYENRMFTGASFPALGVTGFDGFSGGIGTTF